jgi:hypothetical protein
MSVAAVMPPVEVPPSEAYATHGDVAGVPENAAPAHRYSVEETLVILDWDDTILPTSYLTQHNLREDAEDIPTCFVVALEAYAQVAAATIAGLGKLGRVVIVTNAETGWVELTCGKFLPSLQALVEQTEVVSARSKFEPLGFLQPVEWKEKMFDLKIKEHFGIREDPHGPSMDATPQRRNVLSLGDASHEREAIHRVAKPTGCVPKSLKFMERPDLGHLRQEHELIQSYLDELVHHEGPLDLCVHQL